MGRPKLTKVAPKKRRKVPFPTTDLVPQDADGLVAAAHAEKPLVQDNRGRPRNEIRRDVARVFDTTIRNILEINLGRIERHVRALKDLDENGAPAGGMDLKTFMAVKEVAQLYASVGIGQIGAGQMDPAEIPNLPPPVFQTTPVDAPLPDGAPE